MSDANARETRNVFKGIKEDEMKEALKEVPSEILMAELWGRLYHFEEINKRQVALSNCRR